MKNEVWVQIEFFDGQEEGDIGQPYYVASCDDLHFVTDGETFEALLKNIQECLALTLHGGDSAAEYAVSPEAKVRLVLDFVYAETA